MDKNILLDDLDLPFILLNKINFIKKEPKIMIGIVGYAYGYFNKKQNIFQSDFNGQSRAKKIPTKIILDTDLNDVLVFWEECKGYITGYGKKNYEYFKKIKMNLYNKNYII